MKVTEDFIKNIIKAASNAHPGEIGCNDCFDKLHEFAKMELEGKSPQEVMPLVEDHLKKCGDCREEYETLLEVLRIVQN